MVAVRRRLDLRLQRLTPWKRRCSAFVCQLGSSTLAHHQQLLLLLGQLDHSICSIAWPAWPLAGDTWTTLAKTLTPATGFFSGRIRVGHAWTSGMQHRAPTNTATTTSTTASPLPIQPTCVHAHYELPEACPFGTCSGTICRIPFAVLQSACAV